MRKKQFGRSMIEMLGVLAIIGVLSIGGIALYRRAVNNHHANTILDDANRLAFVIMESGRSFEPYDNITGLEYTKTSTYFLNAFTEATSQQLAIMVTDVPKGVCEPLIDKASTEYKVRVLKANSVQEIAQVSPNAVLYDGQNTDICNNDLNDVVLYFGDVSKQCTPIAGKECTSNADCCHGSFCWFSNTSDCTDAGSGQCKRMIDYPAEPITTLDGKSFVYNVPRWLNWWSARNWCEAQGLKPVEREDIGCKSDTTPPYSCTGILSSGHYWLESFSDCAAFVFRATSGKISVDGKHPTAQILCH